MEKSVGLVAQSGASSPDPSCPDGAPQGSATASGRTTNDWPSFSMFHQSLLSTFHHLILKQATNHSRTFQDGVLARASMNDREVTQGERAYALPHLSIRGCKPCQSLVRFVAWHRSKQITAGCMSCKTSWLHVCARLQRFAQTRILHDLLMGHDMFVVDIRSSSVRQ